MTSRTATVIVTGANRGLGREIVKQLAQKPPITPLLIFACARRPSEIKVNQTAKDVSVQPCTLDVTSKESITKFAEAVREQCGNNVDVLINNAGINVDINTKHNLERASQTIHVNFDGYTAMTEAFLPLMRRPALKKLSQSRIVNVSSVGSKLISIPSDSLRQKIRHATSVQEIQGLRNSYLSSVEKGSESSEGWPMGKSYCVSKALVNSYTQVVAGDNHDLLVNACCPGWCQTDMGNLVGHAAKSTADGAKIPLKLAFGAISETGKYWENASVYSTEDGKVAEWNC